MYNESEALSEAATPPVMAVATTTYAFDSITAAAEATLSTERLELARLTLSVAVPITIADLRRRDGPQPHQYEAALTWRREHPLDEALLFAQRGETASMMRQFCECVAIMAFCPGGISVFGLRFEMQTHQVE